MGPPAVIVTSSDRRRYGLGRISPLRHLAYHGGGGVVHPAAGAGAAIINLQVSLQGKLTWISPY